MSKCTICDYKNCGEQINEDAVDKDFEILTDDGVLKITLTAKADFCWVCAKKAKAKLARQAWDQLKQARPKEEGNERHKRG
uniref:Uncharacterized protein n=1 Tax=viral metagenome TaxID=1070528 RepID=A0A6M3LNR5_9ZZZZ